MRANTVSVIGLGRLGICLTAILAGKNYSVTGVDCDSSIVDRINAGQAPFDEAGLQELISANRARIRATGDLAQAVAASEITVILVGTPPGPDGVMSSSHVEEAAGSIGRALRDIDRYHLVILASTVLPGTTQNKIIPAIENSSGKRCGKDFGFCYLPEFVAVGSIIRDMTEPSMVVVGECHPETWPIVQGFYERILRKTPKTPPFFRMNLINAELTKIALNTYVSAKISQANILAELCERLEGADVDVVTRAMGSDPRIGAKGFIGGLGFGGPCFPKDIRTFTSVLSGEGISPAIFDAIEEQNNSILRRVAGYVDELIAGRGDAVVGIFGLSFKPGVVALAHSPGVELAALLAQQTRDVIVHDPLALDAARHLLGARVRYAKSAEECLEASHIAVFTTPEPCYRALSVDCFENHPGPLAVIDCWRMFRFLKDSKSIRYTALGLGPRECAQPDGAGSALARMEEGGSY